jgi:signal transduction histidine kinase
LTNVARHARAAHVWITVRGDHRSVEAVVADDGCGIPGDASLRGHGLISMRERVMGAGGTFSIAPRSGGGTIVRAIVPVEAAR